jgi:hypothetical protein
MILGLARSIISKAVLEESGSKQCAGVMRFALNNKHKKLPSKKRPTSLFDAAPRCKWAIKEQCLFVARAIFPAALR